MRVLHQREELIGYYQRRGYRQTGETAPFPESQRFGNPLVDDLWFVVLEKRCNGDQNRLELMDSRTL